MKIFSHVSWLAPGLSKHDTQVRIPDSQVLAWLYFMFLFFRASLTFSVKASAVEGACPLLARSWLALLGEIPFLPGRM